jgi:hypothetical protein
MQIAAGGTASLEMSVIYKRTIKVSLISFVKTVNVTFISSRVIKIGFFLNGVKSGYVLRINI